MKFLMIAGLLLIGTAQAQEVPPMEFVRPCIVWNWDAASTSGPPISHYEMWARTEKPEGGYNFVFLDSVPVEDGLTYKSCNVEYNQVYELLVRAIDDDGTVGPISDPSDSYVWIHPTDFTNDRITGWADFGLFTRRWNECNNGWMVVPCG
jgi:hypothetical protein